MSQYEGYSNPNYCYSYGKFKPIRSGKINL